MQQDPGLVFKKTLLVPKKEKLALCGAGSGRIGIILAYPYPDLYPGPVDPDPYPFQPNVKLNYSILSSR
jgi:hypothetical protein